MRRHTADPLDDAIGDASPRRPQPQPWKRMGWKDGLSYLLETKGRATSPRKGRHKPVSMKTIEKREIDLFAAFGQLQQMGFHLRTLENFKK